MLLPRRSTRASHSVTRCAVFAGFCRSGSNVHLAQFHMPSCSSGLHPSSDASEQHLASWPGANYYEVIGFCTCEHGEVGVLQQERAGAGGLDETLTGIEHKRHVCVCVCLFVCVATFSACGLKGVPDPPAEFSCGDALVAWESL